VIPDVLRRWELLESGRRLGELAQEEIAAHLAVGDGVDADGLLERHGLVHRAVFDSLELSIRELSRGITFSRLEQVIRAQKATHVVGAVLVHGNPLRRTRAYLSLVP